MYHQPCIPSTSAQVPWYPIKHTGHLLSLEGKEKQVVASFVQLTEANWTHLACTSLIWNTFSNIGGQELDKYWKAGYLAEDVKIWPSIDQHHLPRDGQDMIVKRLEGHGYGPPGIIVVEMGIRGSRFSCIRPQNLLLPGFSGGEIWAMYCPIVPLWPTYMGLARSVVARRRKTEMWGKLIERKLEFDFSAEPTILMGRTNRKLIDWRRAIYSWNTTSNVVGQTYC